MDPPQPARHDTRSLLDSARGGDQRAFDELVRPHHRELHLHCYRMLGSLVDADDALQETLVSAWRGMAGFAERSSLRVWLYRIATTRCLNLIRDGRRRRRAEPVPPFPPPAPSRRTEITWLQPYPDRWLPQADAVTADPSERYLARESVELAFVAALQRLPPRQTAALLLHDVLDFPTAEVAKLLETTPIAVKAALQRARASLRHADPPIEPAPSDTDRSQHRKLAERFARAFTEDDVDAVVTLLTDGAWLSMPPAPHQYQGRAAIAGFLTASAAGRRGRRYRLVSIGANGQPGFGCYLPRPGGSIADGVGLLVLTVRGERIGAVTRFLDPALLPAFGLPESLS